MIGDNTPSVFNLLICFSSDGVLWGLDTSIPGSLLPLSGSAAHNKAAEPQAAEIGSIRRNLFSA